MRSILYPYPTMVGAEPVLRVTRLLLDGVSKPGHIRREQRSIVLHEEHAPWERAELSVELACDREEVEPFEREHGSVDVSVAANCVLTNHRHSVRLKRGANDRYLWSGTLEIDRENVRERTYLIGGMTAKVQGQSHRPVAASAGWTVYVDEPASLLFQGTLRVSWMDFRAPDAPPLARDFARSTHIVDFDGSVPRLLLNSAFEGLHALLGDRKDRKPVDRALHDFQRMSIGRATWLALVAEALAEVQGDPRDSSSELAWPPTEWKAEVLKFVLRRVEPTKSDSDLLALAAGDWRREGAGQFFARAEAVVGELIHANESVRRYVQTYEREAAK